MNIFSRCWSGRRTVAASEPPVIRVPVERRYDGDLAADDRAPDAMGRPTGDTRPGAAPAGAAGPDTAEPSAAEGTDRHTGSTDSAGPPSATLRAAVDQLPDDTERDPGLPPAGTQQAPSLCETFRNCMHVGLHVAVRDFVTVGLANGSAILVRAGLSMARSPAARGSVAAGCAAGAVALVATHWPQTARLLSRDSKLLMALPFLFMVAALVVPALANAQLRDERSRDALDDHFVEVEKTLIILFGSKLAQCIRDHLTQVQYRYWGSMELVRPNGLAPTHPEAERWRNLRTVLQTICYIGLSIGGRIWFSEEIKGWMNDLVGGYKHSEPAGLQFQYQIGEAAPRLAASVAVESLDGVTIGLSAAVAAVLTGSRVRFQAGEDKSLKAAWRAHVTDPAGWRHTRERALLHTGMRMALQTPNDLATALFPFWKTPSSYIGAICNGLTEPRGYLVDECNRARTQASGASALRVAESAEAGAARHGRELELRVTRELFALPEPERRADEVDALFSMVESERKSAAPPQEVRERILYTGDNTVVPGGPAAFARYMASPARGPDR